METLCVRGFLACLVPLAPGVDTIWRDVRRLTRGLGADDLGINEDMVALADPC